MNPVILIAATQRLTQLIAEDEITAPLRNKIEVWAEKYPEGSFPDRLAYAINCKACSSVWAAGLVLGVSRLRVAKPVLQALALSAAALAADRIREH